jgi:chromosomal replication initiator protein
MIETAREYHVHFSDLVSERRDKQSVLARQCAMWRIKRELPWSLPRIGRAFGDRDHTTILHGIRRHQARIDAGEATP